MNNSAKRHWFIVIAAAVLAVVLLAYDLITGPFEIGWLDLCKAILGLDPDSQINTVIMKIRLPGAMTAFLIGGNLAVAGLMIQTLLRCPMGSPFTLGTASAAGFGAAVAMSFNFPLPVVSIPLSAFVTSSASAGFVSCTTRRQSRDTLMLTGVAALFLFNALTALLQYFATEEELQAIVFWLFGSLNRADWYCVGALVLATIIIIPLQFLRSPKLTLLLLGEEVAYGLGVNVKRLRIALLVETSLMTALCVCFTGSIGFVGLAAPHIAAKLVGYDFRKLIPTTFFCGTILLNSANIFSRIVRENAIIPVGIVTSLIGLPFFFILIRKSRRSQP